MNARKIGSIFTTPLSVVDCALNIARKKFISGNQANSDFKKIHAESKDVFLDAFRGKYISRRDSFFPNFNATRIHGSKLIATEGPRTQEEAAKFLAEFGNKGVSNLVVLAEQVSLGHPTEKIPDYIDSISYFFHHFSFLNHRVKIVEHRSFGSITEYQANGNRIIIKLTTGIFDKNDPSTIWQSQITHTHQEVVSHFQTYVFGVADNEGYLLGEDPDNQRKEIIWQLAKRAQHQHIAVHCRAGVGRTGAFIFMLEIINHYDEIFSTKDPAIIAENLLATLERIRMNRPGLVWTEDQFVTAIVNAVKVYEYALVNDYILDTPIVYGPSKQ